MNMIKRTIRIFSVATAGLLLASCGERPPQALTLQLVVDGSEVVKVNGNSLWIEHETYKPPEKIAVNGKVWNAQWNKNVSTKFLDVNPSFTPADPQKVQVIKQSGRGSVAIVQTPSPQNNGTLSFRIDDDEPGSDRYAVRVTW